MPVISPPTAAIRQNQASATIYALLSGFTTPAWPRATSCSTARGATAAQMRPATIPSSALPASATTKAASRCFVGPHPLASPADRFRTIVPGGPPGEPATATLDERLPGRGAAVPWIHRRARINHEDANGGDGINGSRGVAEVAVREGRRT